MKPCLFEEEILDPLVLVQALEGLVQALEGLVQVLEGLIQADPEEEKEKEENDDHYPKIVQVELDVENDKQTVFM